MQDGDALVSPVQAMNEASRFLAQGHVSRIAKGEVQVGVLNSETAMALTIFGIWECAEVAYDDILLPTKLAMADEAFDVLLETGIRIQPLSIWKDACADPDDYSTPDG